jgi:hypothetical protein
LQLCLFICFDLSGKLRCVIRSLFLSSSRFRGRGLALRLHQVSRFFSEHGN